MKNADFLLFSYTLQLRQPATGSFLLLGTTDALLYEEWVEDVLYVQQR